MEIYAPSHMGQQCTLYLHHHTTNPSKTDALNYPMERRRIYRLVIVNYWKTRNTNDVPKSDDKLIQSFLTMPPWYAIIGFVLALIFLIISPKYYKKF